MDYFFAVLGAVVCIVVFVKARPTRVTVYEYERGLKYVRGAFEEVLGPGQYWYLGMFSAIQKVDVRPRFLSVAGQEVLSSDGVTLKVSIAANYEVADPNTAINKVQDYHSALYLELQLALREIVGAVDIDTVLATRGELNTKLMQAGEPKARPLGLKLISVSVKDIMFPGKLKDVFAQVVNARKEGLAALEKARGETAALRNLANAANMIEANPVLMQLRVLQVLGEKSGNTVVLGMPSQQSLLPIKVRDAPQITDKDAPADTQADS